MKLFTIIAMSILTACSKGEIQYPEPQCLSATFYVDTYRDNSFKELIGTHVAIHFCNVCGDLLETYKKLDGNSLVCPGEPIRQRIVIGLDTCKTSIR